MANLMSGDWDTIFNKNYEGKFQNIQENLLVHHSESPYQDRSPKKIKTVINILNGKTNTVINDFNNKSERIISDMRIKETQMAKSLGAYCIEQLSFMSGINMTNLNNDYQELNSSIENNFIHGIKCLNKIFLFYSKVKMGNLINEQGYYDSEKFFEQGNIKSIMSSTFEEFIKIFTSDKYGDITTKIRSKSQIEKNFLDVMNSFLDEQKTAEKNGNWEIAAAYEGIINYCTGRGITLINYLKETNKKIDSFDTTKEDLMGKASNSNLTFSNELSFLISKANKHKVHTTIRKKNKAGKNEHESIEGSFYGSIKSPNQGGIILEYLDTLLLNPTYELNLSSPIRSKNTGRTPNVLGKAQKNDIIASIGLSLKENLEDKKTINTIGKSNLINTASSQIGISVKNYKSGSDIAVHSAGNLKTITNFLRTYNTINFNNVKDFCDYLDSTIVQYFLINEIDDSNSAFLKALKDSLAKQGAIFTLTPYILDTKNGLIDESVDFFLIDQVLIPGSLIMEYALKALELGKKVKNNSLKAGIGYTTKITGEKPDDFELQNYSHSIEKGTKGRDFPYGKNYLSRFELGEKTFNKITFRIEMRESFKKNLQKLITNVGG